MKTVNTKRQAGFFVIGIGAVLFAIAAATGLTINAAVEQDDDRAAQEQQVQVAATTTHVTDSPHL